MNHSFDIEIAQKYGVEEAILINNLQYWILKNRANEAHFHDGRTWTYNTVEAFRKLFPYWTDKQIRRILISLKEKGVIITGNYNKSSYDRTLWYAFCDELYFLDGQIHFPKQENGKSDSGKSHLPKQENGFDEKGGPIPNINPTSKPNENPDNKPSENSEPEKELPVETEALANMMVRLHKQYQDQKYNPKDEQVQKWRKDIDLLHRKDGRSWEDIERVIRYVKTMPVRNGFTWATNIMSGAKLREKFDQIFPQAIQAGNCRAGSGPRHNVIEMHKGSQDTRTEEQKRRDIEEVERIKKSGIF